MTRRIALRAALAAMALAAAPGCTRDDEFDLIKVFHVSTTANAFGPDVQQVNLVNEAGSAWDHRDKLKKVEVVTITAVASDVANQKTPNSGSGTVKLRPSGAPANGSGDVLMGSWTGIPIENASWISAPGNDALNAGVDAALQGDGLMSFVLQGSADSNFTADVTVTVHVKVEWNVL